MSNDKKIPSSWPYDEGAEEITAAQRVIFKVSRERKAFSKLSDIILSGKVVKGVPRWQLLTHGIILNAIEARRVIMFIRQCYWNLTRKDILEEIMPLQKEEKEVVESLAERQTLKLMKKSSEFVRRWKASIFN